MLLQLLVMKPGIRGFANVSSIRTTWMDGNQIARPHPKSAVSEVWAPENIHLSRVLNDMTVMLDHSFEDSILPLSPNS